MFHPFLDTSKLTDEEIMNKLTKLYQVLTHQEAMGHAGMYQNVLTVIQDLELEQQTRMSNELIKQEIEENKQLEFGEVTDELGIDYDEDL